MTTGTATRYLYLVCHGEAASEESGLTEGGRRQAMLLGQRLRGIPLAAIHHGPLPRAEQTARLIGDQLKNVPLRVSEAAGDYVPYMPVREELPAESADIFLRPPSSSRTTCGICPPSSDCAARVAGRLGERAEGGLTPAGTAGLAADGGDDVDELGVVDRLDCGDHAGLVERGELRCRWQWLGSYRAPDRQCAGVHDPPDQPGSPDSPGGKRFSETPFREELVVSTPRFNRADGATAMAHLLDLEEPPDAVFCYSDLVALGALHTLASRGLRVPEDVAVVGYDDVEGTAATPIRPSPRSPRTRR